MPLYDFRCEQCEGEFEARAEPGAGAQCPRCGAPDARRLFRPIAPPARIGLRGEAARRSDATRRTREEQRHAGFRQSRRRAEEGG